MKYLILKCSNIPGFPNNFVSFLCLAKWENKMFPFNRKINKFLLCIIQICTGGGRGSIFFAHMYIVQRPNS
jgi:hypothetical protein